MFSDATEVSNSLVYPLKSSSSIVVVPPLDIESDFFTVLLSAVEESSPLWPSSLRFYNSWIYTLCA